MKKKWKTNKKSKTEKKRKRGPQGVPPETAQKKCFFFKEMLQEIVQQLRPKKKDSELKKKWRIRIKREKKHLDPKGRTPPFRRLRCN